MAEPSEGERPTSRTSRDGPFRRGIVAVPLPLIGARRDGIRCITGPTRLASTPLRPPPAPRIVWRRGRRRRRPTCALPDRRLGRQQQINRRRPARPSGVAAGPRRARRLGQIGPSAVGRQRGPRVGLTDVLVGPLGGGWAEAGQPDTGPAVNA